MKAGLAILILSMSSSLAFADTCTAIKFQRGKSGAVVQGQAYSDPTYQPNKAAPA